MIITSRTIVRFAGLLAALTLLAACQQATSSSKVAVTGITISGNAYLTKTNSQTLTATITPSNASNTSVTWSITSNTSPYASTIDATTGVLTAGSSVGPLTVTATAQDGSGVSATFTVTVQNPSA